MRLFYILLICCMVNMFLPAQQEQSKINVQANINKILTSLLATIYKHPFMTCWSLYATFYPSTITTIKSGGEKEVIRHFNPLAWIVDAFLLGDFAHNLLHAYNIGHQPCDNKVNKYYINLEIHETIEKDQSNESVEKSQLSDIKIN